MEDPVEVEEILLVRPGGDRVLVEIWPDVVLVRERPAGSSRWGPPLEGPRPVAAGGAVAGPGQGRPPAGEVNGGYV